MLEVSPQKQFLPPPFIVAAVRDKCLLCIIAVSSSGRDSWLNANSCLRRGVYDLPQQKMRPRSIGWLGCWLWVSTDLRTRLIGPGNFHPSQSILPDWSRLGPRVTATTAPAKLIYGWIMIRFLGENQRKVETIFPPCWRKSLWKRDLLHVIWIFREMDASNKPIIRVFYPYRSRKMTKSLVTLIDTLLAWSSFPNGGQMQTEE